MPKLWTETIEEHRDAVRDALIDAVGDLVALSGVAGLSMAAIASRAGVGRATLYRYFPDLEAILRAWHERHVGRHLAALAAARDDEVDAEGRLVALFESYVRVVRESARHGGGAMAGLLHRAPHMAGAERQVRALLRAALADAAAAGAIRKDVPSEELTEFVLAALGAADGLSAAASERLVAVTMAGLKSPPAASRRR